MDSSRRPSATPTKSRLARTFSKVLHARTTTGITPVDGLERVKSDKKIREVRTDHKIKVEKSNGGEHKSFGPKDEEELRMRVALEALIARVFASISCIKAAYAQLQLAQSPYDADGIQASDSEVVSELKVISELKQCYLKKQFDDFPEKFLISAEIQELNSVLKTYELMKKKLESQLQLKESEAIFLREKLEESRKDNRSMEKRLNASGQISAPDNLHLSGLSPTHFIPVVRHTVRSIRSFVKLMVSEMQSAGWDVDDAASLIQPGVVYWKQDHKCYTFESFVCREMFDSFHYPNFSLPNEFLPDDQKQRRRLFFERFVELKTVKANDYFSQKPKSTFGKFCRAKYLKLIHPKLESSFSGNLSERNLVNSGEFPDTDFFTTFAEMAKRVWLLHCLAFSFDPPAMIFQVRNGCRFSEVFMESLADDKPSLEPSNDTSEMLTKEPLVAFTVVPGFKIGKTVIQSQVYLSRSLLRTCPR